MKRTKAKVSLAIGAVLCSCFGIIKTATTQNTYADTNEDAAVMSVIDALTTKYQSMINTYNTAHPNETIQLYSSDDNGCIMLPTNSGIMQTYTLGSVDISKVCDNSFIKLKDNRDNTTYTVAKLADGNVWMLDNLALDLITNGSVLNSTNTNASDTSLGYLLGTTSRDPETDPNGKYATAGVSSTWTSAEQNYYSIPMINKNSINITGPANEQWGNGSHKYGIYYNFCAASAGTYCFGNETEQATSTGNATEDICPAGWRLPTGNQSASDNFLKLCSLIGNEECPIGEGIVKEMDATSPSSLQYQLSIPLSGYFFDGSVQDANTRGDIWSSTRSDDHSMWYLRAYANNIEIRKSAYREGANSIRCVLKSTNPTEEESSLFDDYNPHFKPESVKGYIQLNKISKLIITTTKDNQPAPVLETAPIFETLTALGFTAYGPTLSNKAEQYLNTETGVICIVSKIGSSCGHTNWQTITDEWKDFIAGIGEAFYKVTKEYPVIDEDVISENTPSIIDSDHEPYQYTIVKINGENGLFYRKDPSSEWIYFGSFQDIPECSVFTDEAAKGFTGLTCRLSNGDLSKVSDLLVPDTGSFTGQQDSITAIIYVGIATIGTGLLYLVFYSAKRGLTRNRFRK